MTLITRRPENRLARVIFAPGGKTIAQALDDAQHNLDEIRGASLDLLRVKLEAIQALARQGQAAPTAATAQTIYTLSSEVIDIAGLYDLAELGQASLSLCELIDRFGARKTWNWPAVQVHLHGLLILADPDKTPPEARHSVVEGLRQVNARMAR